MSKVLTFLMSAFYIWAMEFVQCPICNKTHLLKLPGYARHKGEFVMCANEHYQHIIRAGKHYLARTVKNVLEESELALN